MKFIQEMNDTLMIFMCIKTVYTVTYQARNYYRNRNKLSLFPRDRESGYIQFYNILKDWQTFIDNIILEGINS